MLSLRFALILAALTLSACNLSVTTFTSPSEADGFQRCPNDPGRFYKSGFEDTICYD